MTRGLHTKSNGLARSFSEMSSAAELEDGAPTMPSASEGLAEAGKRVTTKGKVKSLRISQNHAGITDPPDDDASPGDIDAWSLRNEIDLATDVRVELESGSVFRWLADPELDGYEIASRVQMVTLIREAFMTNRSVVIHSIVEPIPTASRTSSELTINRVQAVEVVGVNL